LLDMAAFTPFIREGKDNQKAWEKSSTQSQRRCGITR